MVANVALLKFSRLILLGLKVYGCGDSDYAKVCEKVISCDVCALLDRAIRHRACALKDTAYALISTELDPEFEKLCEDIAKARERRGKWMKMCAVLFILPLR